MCDIHKNIISYEVEYFYKKKCFKYTVRCILIDSHLKIYLISEEHANFL